MNEASSKSVDKINKRSCGIIVTYNKVPNLDQYNAAMLKGELDGLIIVDNSNRLEIIAGIKSLFIAENAEKYYLIENHENLGISKALNKGITMALEKGYYYIFLLDDDAIVDKNFFKREINVFDELSGRGQKVGAVCPTVSNNPNRLGQKTKSYDLSEMSAAITSGLLINERTVRIVGLYPEYLFLEMADIVYTTRIIKSGLKIFRINEVLIFQDFGKTIKERKMSFFPYYILVKFMHTITYNLNRRNDDPNYLPVYSPERVTNIYETRKKLSYEIIKRKTRINILLNQLRITIEWVISAVLLSIATGDSDYMKKYKRGKKL